MKKFLSLVMTLAMAVSLFAFAAPSAGAKSFSDGNSIQYKEAVNVISEIQVMDGRTADTFVPGDPLTRQAAAKIICNMILGPTTAKALPTNQNPFPDVQAGTEFAGYISYCAENGIISGYADGTFRPGDPLSGYAYLKMLLGALGYDAVRESYVGANWKVNVAKQALGIGLDSSLNGDLDASRTVTREEAALYAFNTIKADMVEYDEGSTVTLNGQVISVGGSSSAKAKVWNTSSTGSGNIDRTRSQVNGADIIQFGEYYFNKLEQDDGIRDGFGRPSTKWFYKGVEIGTYPESLVETYYGNVSISSIYNKLNMPDSDLAEYYVNGMRYGDTWHDDNSNRARDDDEWYVDFKRSNGDELNDYTKYVAPQNGTAADSNLVADGLIGDGTITEVYRDDDNNHVIICSMSVYAGKISSVRSATSKKNAYVIMEAFGNDQPTYRTDGAGNFVDKRGAVTTDPGDFVEVTAGGRKPRTISADSERREYETTAFSVDDIVWYTYSDADREIKDMGKLESIQGSVTSRIAGDSVTLNGTKYGYGKTYTFETGINEADLTNNTDVVVYVDSQKNILFVEDADFEVESYAALTNIETHRGNFTYTFRNPDGINDQTTSWNDDRAHLVFADGIERNVYLDDNYLRSNAASPTGFSLKGWVDEPQIVRYKVVDGEYKLYEVSNTKQVADVAAGDIHIQNKSAWFGVAGGANNRIYTDSATVFVIQEGTGSFKVYTGQRNAPDVDTFDANGNAVANAIVYFTGTGDGRVAKLVYVRQAADVTSVSTQVTFLSGKSASKIIDESGDDPYREYTAVIGGSIETISVKANATFTDWRTGAELLDVSGNNYDVDKAFCSVILNDLSWDGDFLESGMFRNNKYESYDAQGIKTTGSNYEIRVGTNEGVDAEGNYIMGSGLLKDLASDVSIYYAAADGSIVSYSVSQIETDEDDFIYWTEDDGLITNLFICEYEP